MDSVGRSQKCLKLMKKLNNAIRHYEVDIRFYNL